MSSTTLGGDTRRLFPRLMRPPLTPIRTYTYIDFIVALSVRISQIRRAAISVGLMRSHALWLSTYGQIEAIIRPLGCHVNIVTVTTPKETSTRALKL